MKEFVIGSKDCGQKSIKYLQKVMKDAPTSFFYKMIRKKNIVINGKKCTGNEVLSEGDNIQIFVSDETFDKFSGISSDIDISQYLKAFDTLKGIEVIYESFDIVILNKPSGILSQKSTPSDLSLNEWLIGYLINSGKTDNKDLQTFKPSVCNRLDRNTSGLVICSKTLVGASVASKIIASREIRKFYHCIVEGNCDLDLVYEGFLVKDEKNNKVFIYDSEDKVPREFIASKIKTGIKALKTNGEHTLMEIELFTGKTHQIRACLSHLGYPIAGDIKYSDIKEHTEGQLLSCVRLEFPKEVSEIPDLSGKVIEIPDSFTL